MKLNYRQLALELTMKIMAVTALSYFIKTVLENYMMTGNPVVLLLLVGECITVFLVVFSKFTETRNFSLLPVLATMGATFYFFAIALGGGGQIDFR